jgi:hypothetical protein
MADGGEYSEDFDSGGEAPETTSQAQTGKQIRTKKKAKPALSESRSLST